MSTKLYPVTCYVDGKLLSKIIEANEARKDGGTKLGRCIVLELAKHFGIEAHAPITKN